ncbi:hypothetical protein HAX54_024407, partial [Datura stramonium]|nr:hypothetical protein [Datura stramonium]
TVQADSVITLAIKTEKDAPSMEREKCTENRIPPPLSASSHTSTFKLDTVVIPTPVPLDFLKVEQRA